MYHSVFVILGFALALANAGILRHNVVTLLEPNTKDALASDGIFISNVGPDNIYLASVNLGYPHHEIEQNDPSYFDQNQVLINHDDNSVVIETAPGVYHRSTYNQHLVHRPLEAHRVITHLQPVESHHVFAHHEPSESQHFLEHQQVVAHHPVIDHQPVVEHHPVVDHHVGRVVSSTPATFFEHHESLRHGVSPFASVTPVPLYHKNLESVTPSPIAFSSTPFSIGATPISSGAIPVVAVTPAPFVTHHEGVVSQINPVIQHVGSPVVQHTSSPVIQHVGSTVIQSAASPVIQAASTPVVSHIPPEVVHNEALVGGNVVSHADSETPISHVSAGPLAESHVATPTGVVEKLHPVVEQRESYAATQKIAHVDAPTVPLVAQEAKVVATEKHNGIVKVHKVITKVKPFKVSPNFVAVGPTATYIAPGTGIRGQYLHDDSEKKLHEDGVYKGEFFHLLAKKPLD